MWKTHCFFVDNFFSHAYTKNTLVDYTLLAHSYLQGLNCQWCIVKGKFYANITRNTDWRGNYTSYNLPFRIQNQIQIIKNMWNKYSLKKSIQKMVDAKVENLQAELDNEIVEIDNQAQIDIDAIKAKAESDKEFAHANQISNFFKSFNL